VNDAAGLAITPQPPYYAVIFTSMRTEGDRGYAEVARRMIELARSQPGFLGVESARNGLGITVSYWADEAAIAAWRSNAEHRLAQARSREWYAAFRVRVCRVEREYGY
jgi:heme-degrading monooxygenase HmoA